MSRGLMLQLSSMLFVALTLGCNRHPSDEQIQEDIQTKAAADTETKDSAVKVAAEDGKVTLTGSVRNEAAAKELKKIAKEEPGVTEVDDQTSIDMSALSATVIQPPPPSPLPPPQPVVVPAGTELTVRLGQELSSKTTQPGAVFAAIMAHPITVDGRMVIPAGAEASGVVREATNAGRVKGAATLAVDLTAIVVRGHKYNVQTEFIGQTSTGNDKRTAGMMAGGAGTGSGIGGFAAGGQGAGRGAFAGVTAGTGNRDITLPAESALSFKLDQPVTLRP